MIFGAALDWFSAYECMLMATYPGAPGLIAWLDQGSMHVLYKQCYERRIGILPVLLVAFYCNYNANSNNLSTENESENIS